VPDSIPPSCPQSCEPFITACEPDETEEPEAEELADFGGSFGCDVIDPSCGPDSETCPQSSEPPGCPQSGEPPGCPQSPA
jgi:hypothetical protein